MSELPFMATEEILMAGVRAGGDRQELHERIRTHSLAASEIVKSQGKPNDLIERLAQDTAFNKVELSKVLNPVSFVGRAPQQVDRFIKQIVEPIRRRYEDQLGQQVELKV